MYFAVEAHFSTMNAAVVEFIHVEDLTISTTSKSFHNAMLHKHKSASTNMEVQAQVGETTSFSLTVKCGKDDGVVCLHYYYVEHTICRWSQVGFQLWSIMSGPHLV